MKRGHDDVSRNKVSVRVYICAGLDGPLADVIKVCRRPLLRLLQPGGGQLGTDAVVFPASIRKVFLPRRRRLPSEDIGLSWEWF